MTVSPIAHRTLGSSGAVVTEFALGTMTFGNEADEATSHKLLDHFVEAGGTFVDTADVYSGGESENIVGRWLAARPTESAQVVIATKARFAMGAGPNDLGTSRRHLRVALDASLERLGVDHIDLYQLHAWDPITPIEESLRFLDDAVTAGKIGYYGLANFTGWQLTKAVHTARTNGWNIPVTLQPQYSLLVRGIESEIVPAAMDAGLGLLPWGPLTGGWLSGKYERDSMPTGATRLGENPTRGIEAYAGWNSREQTWNILDAVSRIADAHEVTRAHVSLAWLKERPGVTSVILGARSVEQLADNLAASALVLTAEERAELDQVSAPDLAEYPYGSAGVEQRDRRIDGGR